MSGEGNSCPKREDFKPVNAPNLADYNDDDSYEIAWNAWTYAEDEYATACALWQEENGDGS